MSLLIRNPAWIALLASGAALLAQPAAAQSPAPMVRICDSSGCSDRPRDTATFDPLADDNPEETRRIKALSDIAAKDPRAAYDLGIRYLRGDGVKRDGSTGIHWLREAGDRGDPRAQAALGHLYLTGLEEMGSDPAEAEKWLSLAAERGDREAAKLLPEARKAKQDEQARYKLREHERNNGWGWWYASYPYYWTWRDGWYVGR
jgi:TPR repeat protein